MSELKEIGTEFWHEFPVSRSDTRSVQDRFLYRVVAHDDIWPKGKAERVDVVAHETRPITAIKSIKLSDRTVWDYEFGEWCRVTSTPEGSANRD